MIKHYTDKELTDILSRLTVITDTREQENAHVLKYLDGKKIPHILRKLDIGDYSAQLDDMTFERDIIVERKHNLDEICGNLTADRDRFEREFLRATAYGTKVYLLIENATWDDVFLHNYRSKLSEKSLAASLLSWSARFNVTVLFVNSGNSGRIIHGILYYYTREKLLGNK